MKLNVTFAVTFLAFNKKQSISIFYLLYYFFSTDYVMFSL